MPNSVFDLTSLIFYKTGAMSFQEKTIPADIVEETLRATTSCAGLGLWKLIAVTEKQNIERIVEVLQKNSRKWQRHDRGAQFLERWKRAPLIIAFFIPKPIPPFQWITAGATQTYEIQEVGTAVRSMELVALTRGIGLHGIMGALLANEGLKEILKVPTEYEIVFLGVMGYPKEEVESNFPSLKDVCYKESWANPFQTQQQM